jgi:hypothetical protein
MISVLLKATIDASLLMFPASQSCQFLKINTEIVLLAWGYSPRFAQQELDLSILSSSCLAKSSRTVELDIHFAAAWIYHTCSLLQAC